MEEHEKKLKKAREEQGQTYNIISKEKEQQENPQKEDHKEDPTNEDHKEETQENPKNEDHKEDTQEDTQPSESEPEEKQNLIRNMLSKLKSI